MILFGFIVLACIVWLGIVSILYRKTGYFKNTRNSFSSVLFDKGRHGEYLIYKYLRKQEKSGARFLFNLYLPKSDGETTEIDVLLVNKDGIFVFESKNYSGWIFGSENQKNWTQCLPQGKGKPAQKEHFLNPIYQNKLHISTLRKIIIEDISCYSIIVFSERCTLKEISVSDPTVSVIKRNQVKAAVKCFSSADAAGLSQSDIDRIYDTLLPYTQVSSEVKEKHIQEIQKKHLEQPADPVPAEKSEPKQPDSLEKDEMYEKQDLICPRCGGTLVLRTATRGNNKGKPFYGCSNYPKCRYIQNL